MLSVNFDVHFHFIDQFMHAFIMLAIKATSEVFVNVMFSSNYVIVYCKE